jgi:Gram-negative bacterial TonB protein C-terminal
VVPPVEKAKPLRKIAPKGPGSAPGHGDIPEKVPTKGSSAFHKSLTVVSNPPHPDNNHQTIIQPASPPDLIIKHDVKLPNIVLGEPLPQPKSPTIALSWKNPAPKPATPNAPKNSAVPTTTTPRTDPIVFGNIVPEASLPVAPPSEPAPIPAASAAASTNADSSGAKIQGASGGKDLIAFGTDPDGRATTLALPPGNRYGAFSLSPDGGSGMGSAGGSGNGTPGAGTGGKGPGGNASTGVGNGLNGGGGGATSGDPGSVSVAGTDGTGSREMELKAAIAATMVYPVLNPINLRKNMMVVSSGYVGGGGLGVYKALSCSKIYTVFLNMPGENWSLEYCPRVAQTTEATATVSGHTSVVHLEQGVIPPDATQVFDFKRLPVAEDDSRKMIILRGFIQEDGSVSDVKIYRGLEPRMDEAAKIAFSKWKFKPALQGGKNIPVEFLVGIPVKENPAK